MESLSSIAPHLVLLLFVVVGTFGSAIPAFPGAVLVFVGALIHGFWTGWTPLGPAVLVVLFVLMLVAWAVQYVIAAAGAKKYGASNWGVFGAGVGMLAGLLVFSPVPILGTLLGPLIGAFCGALATELVVRWIKEQNLPEGEEPSEGGGREAARAGFGAALGAVLGLMAELGVTLLMVGVIMSAFLFSWIF